MPKIHEKSIIRLESDEIPKFLNTVEFGYGLSGHAVGFHKKTQKRDIAMLTLLLGTGMRVSECVGLNLTDIDFKINGLKITRKGGNQVVLYFSDEVKVPLVDYINERNLAFNRKLGRYYDRFTSDIRANLERGSAV